MNNPPLVSIITPCHNNSVTIRDTVKSVIDQSYENWELLVIDDASTDDTSQIIQEFMLSDPRIKYLKTDIATGSPAVPRNIGIENASGKYLAFLDADDEWMSHKLERQISFMEENRYQLSYCYYEKMDFNGNRNNRIVQTRKAVSYNDLLKSNSIPCLTSVISKDAVGVTRFKQIPQEDFCFWLDILKKGYVAYNVCEVCALYRDSKHSRSTNKIEMFKGYWKVIRNHQKIDLFHCCYYMLTYTILGILKYIK